MIEAMELLRKAADEFERQAGKPESGRTVKAEMIDLASRVHWMAGKAAVLCRQSKGSSRINDAECARCLEKCLDLGPDLMTISAKASAPRRDRAVLTD